MYQPEAFRQLDQEAIRALIAAHPLATLVFQAEHGLEANHIPLFHVPDTRDAAGNGTLIGHVSKANSLWRSYPSGSEALAIFHGPNHYISPNWYPSKHEHGRAVPTWNYATVHVHGTLTIHPDADWLLAAVTHLTDYAEASQPQPWKVTDAPAEFTSGMLKAIVGVELHITRIEAKWKVSQNRSNEDRASVAAALDAIDTAQSRAMAQLVRAGTRGALG